MQGEGNLLEKCSRVDKRNCKRTLLELFTHNRKEKQISLDARRWVDGSR
jgi:hypothetical protein